MAFIPFNLPYIGQEEIDEVIDTLRSGWLTTGAKTARFERELQQYVHARNALATNSATAALHLALAALNIGPGDEVITTPLTFCSTVNTIYQVGATPVLADVQDDGNIDPDSVAARATERTRAVVPVHLGGLPCDMNAIWQLARKHGWYVIEDAAHAIGSRYRGDMIGSSINSSGNSSDAVCFSFYATKNITTGEGGMVVTGRDELHERMKLLCLHGISKDAWNRYEEDGNWYYEVSACGFKYNLSDIAAAIGIHQLRKLDDFIERRTNYAAQFNESFAGLPEVDIPPDNALDRTRNSWHLYAIRLNLKSLTIGRDTFISQLHRRGVGASVHFIPIPLHPAYAGLKGRNNDCPRALSLYPRLVSLPLYPSLSEGQVAHIANTVKDLIMSHRSVQVPGITFENMATNR